MHNKIANDKAVPIIGDMMTSRWAYEALAVSQFKDNVYEKYFYEAESRAKNAGYFRSYAIPGLIEIARDTKELHDNNTDTFRYSNNLLVLRSELSIISHDIGQKAPAFVDSLTPDLYNPVINASINGLLDRALIIYRYRYNRAVSDRDKTYIDLVAKLGGDESFQQFKQKYYNKQLAFVVTNEKEIQQCITPGIVVLRRDPKGFNLPGNTAVEQIE
jgi:hypothetical protein